MKGNTRCFVFADNGYKEITYAALEEHRMADPAYAGKRFIGIQGMILEVTKADYLDFYKDKRRQKYIAEEAASNGEFSYNTLDSEKMSGKNIIVDDSPLPDEQVLDKMMIEEMLHCLGELPEADRALLTAYYFDGKFEVCFSKELCVTQQAVSKRLKQAIGRLRKLMKQ